jgi:urease gamma subunit
MGHEQEKTLPESINIPEEFYKIIKDFTSDIVITFPEYSKIIQRWWKTIDDSHILDENEKQRLDIEVKNNTLYVFKHCLKIVPERFFDILYKNNEIFQEDSVVNTEFLPGIVFKQLWSCDISENTRETIWKYLQLILFSVIGSVHNTAELGDSAKLFEAINEDELKTKLEETFEGMKNLFTNLNETETKNANVETTEDGDNINMPTPDDVHKHINEMMGGKLGKLAMELAEETAENLNIDMQNVNTSQEVFQKLFSNPGKLMEMVKNVGGKIDEKIKSGEIKESELMSEGVDILNKMKNMPGMENMASMLSKLGIPGVGKGTKLNTSAIESKLQKNLKMAQMKERMKNKMAQKKENVSSSPLVKEPINTLSDEQIISIFSTGEKVDKTPRNSKPIEQNDKNKKKAKKGKA